MADVKVESVKPPPPRVYINLNLSEDEARAFAEIMSKVSGDSINTHRAVTDRILWELRGEGIEYNSGEFLESGGYLHFKETNKENK